MSLVKFLTWIGFNVLCGVSLVFLAILFVLHVVLYYVDLSLTEAANSLSNLVDKACEVAQRIIDGEESDDDDC